MRPAGPSLGRLLALRLAARIAVQALPFDRACRWALPTRVEPRPSRSNERWIVAAHLHAARRAFGTRLTRTRCLLRALVLFRLLRERGVPVELRLGLRSHGEELRGHAWLVLDGHPIDETVEGSWTTTFRFPESGE